jgi:hypothetical protein
VGGAQIEIVGPDREDDPNRDRCGLACYATAFAVIVGSKGVVNWVDREVRVALSRATSEKNYPFIPVFASQDSLSSLPPFARQFHGVHDPIKNETELAARSSLSSQISSPAGLASGDARSRRFNSCAVCVSTPE